MCPRFDSWWHHKEEERYCDAAACDTSLFLLPPSPCLCFVFVAYRLPFLAGGRLPCAVDRAPVSKSASVVFSSHKYLHTMETTPYFSSVHDLASSDVASTNSATSSWSHSSPTFVEERIIAICISYVASVVKSSNRYLSSSMVARVKTPLSASCKPCIPIRSPLVSKSIPRRSSRIYRVCTLL